MLNNSNGSAFEVNNGTQARARLDNHVWDAHLTAQSRDEHDQLNGVDVVGNHDKISLLRLNQGNTVVQTIFDEERLLAISLRVNLVAGRDLLSDGIETCLLLLLRLWTVLVHELEQSRRSVLVKRVGELSDRRWHLQTLLENDTLALQTDVLRPLDKARQVTRRLNVLT